MPKYDAQARHLLHQGYAPGLAPGWVWLGALLASYGLVVLVCWGVWG